MWLTSTRVQTELKNIRKEAFLKNTDLFDHSKSVSIQFLNAIAVIWQGVLNIHSQKDRNISTLVFAIA